MVIRNLVKFREWVKEEYGAGSEHLHPHYMGIETEEETSKKFGFYYLFHGINRSGLRNALFGSLQLAEDTQGIYEFIQNSADCGSTYFSIFYNEDYFLAFNNGSKFTNSNVIAILNEGDSDKTDGSSIGRFGVGFKIVHRLVGETDGLNELVDEEAPRGPVVFSWNKKSDIEKFINLSAEDLIYENSSEKFITKDDKGDYPWLFKILLTNFPTAPTQQEFKTVKGLDCFQTKQKGFYTREELKEFVDFLNLFQTELERKTERRLFDNGDGLFESEGSLFFIKLGKDKNKKIDKDIEKLEDGVQFSLNFLGYDNQQNSTQVVRQLKTINLNNREFTTRKLEKEDAFIEHTNPLFKKLIYGESTTPIKITFGYQPYKPKNDYEEEIIDLRTRPNFFKFFPMDKETIGLNFVIHSDAFIIEKSRRELQQDDPRNIIIFDYLIDYLTTQLNDYQKIPVNSEYFLDIYAAILTSRTPQEAHLWIKSALYEPLLEYLKGNIPTVHFEDFEKSIERRVKQSITNVKSKKTQLNVEPLELGLSNIEWFFWNKNNYQTIESEAFLKLGLERWDIIDLIEKSVHQGHVERVNQWIKSLSEDEYKTLLEEIDNSERVNSLESKDLQVVKVFKCSDGLFYNIADFLNKEKNVVFTFDLIDGYQEILNQIGIKTSIFKIEKYSYIKNKLKDEVKYLGDLQSNLYDNFIKPKFPNNELNASQRIKFFDLLLSNTFKGISYNLRHLKLFYSNENRNDYKSLNELISIKDERLPDWLNAFKIHEDFNKQNLEKYLKPFKNIYSEIILENWDNLIGNITENNVVEFYQKIDELYDEAENRRPFTEQETTYNFIFTSNGFQSKETIFSHQKIGNTQSILSKFLPNKLFPIHDILEYLHKTNSPFYIEQNSFIETAKFEKIQFTEEEAIQFLEYAKAAKEPIFEIGYFTDDYTFIANKEKKQFYTNNEEPIFLNFILKYFSEDYKILPEILAKVDNNLSNLSLKTSGIRQEITDKVTFENKTLFHEYIDIVKTSFGEQLKKSYLNKIDKLELSTDKIYNENSFEYKAILLYIDNYKVYKDFKEKIFINNIQLTTIKYKEEIQLNTPNNKTIKLPYAQILPNDADNNSVLIDKILEQFKADVFQNIFVKESDDTNKIYTNLKKNYPKFINLHQFAFILYHESNQLQITQYQHFSKKDVIDFFFENKFEITDKLISIINLNVNNKVNIFPTKYALPNELLNPILQNWIGKDDKKEKFIAQFGVFISNSSVVKLRQFFLDENTLNIANVSVAELSGQEVIFQNTINWLFTQSLNFNETTDNQKINIIQQLYKKLNNYYPNLPIPTIIKFVNNQRIYALNPKRNIIYWYPQTRKLQQNFDKLFTVCNQEQFQIIDKSFFNHVWINNLKTVKEFEVNIQSILDEEELRKIHNPLKTDFYLEWKRDFPNLTIHQVDNIPHKEVFFGHKIYSTPTDRVTETYKQDGYNYYVKGDLINVLKAKNVTLYNQLQEYKQFIFIRQKLNSVQSTTHSINNINSEKLIEKLLSHSKGKEFQENDTRLNIIKDIYRKMNITSDNYPLILMRFAQNGTVSYEINNKNLKLFKGINNLPVTIQEKIKIQQIIIQNNYSLLADNHLPSIPSESITIQEKIDTSNVTKLWDAEHYNKWSHKDEFKVFLVNGQVQYHKQFLGQNISNTAFIKGNAINNDNIIYINQGLNTDKELEKLIPFQYFKSLKTLRVDITIDAHRAKIINTYDIPAHELEAILAEWKNKKDSQTTKPNPNITLKPKPNLWQKVIGYFTKSNEKGVDVEKNDNKTGRKKLINTQSFSDFVNYNETTTLRITAEQWEKINKLQPNEDYYIAYETSNGEIKYLRIFNENII